MMLLVFLCTLTTSVIQGERCMRGQKCSSCDSESESCISKCETGYYGPQCTFPCGPNCKNNKCTLDNNGNYFCPEGCVPGYYGNRCKIPCYQAQQQCQKCPSSCVEGFCYLGSRCVSQCTDSYYGVECFDCDRTCKNCSGNKGPCNACPKCSQTVSEQCQNCIGGNCVCRQGCLPGYTGKRCDQRCSNNCAYMCDQLHGKCAHCKTGWHGETCMKKCSGGCANSNCLINGTCDDSGCRTGFYGNDCSKNCPENCFQGLCSDNGLCLTCKSLFYGDFCNMSCENCLDGICNKTTGSCIRGCNKPFLTGTYCEHDCENNCTVTNCRKYDKCRAGHSETEKNSQGGTIYILYWVVGVSAIVIGVFVATVYVLCRLKRVHNMMYGGVKWQREPAPIHECNEEESQNLEPVSNYYEINEDGISSNAQGRSLPIQDDIYVKYILPRDDNDVDTPPQLSDEDEHGGINDSGSIQQAIKVDIDKESDLDVVTENEPTEEWEMSSDIPVIADCFPCDDRADDIEADLHFQYPDNYARPFLSN